MALEIEKQTYERLYPTFKDDHKHDFIVISGEDVLGFFKRFETAAMAAWDKFGDAPFLIKEIDAEPLVMPFLVINEE